MRNRILVVGKISFIRASKIAMNVLQLHEKKWQPIYKTHNVGSPAIERTFYAKFADTQEMICLGVGKVEDAQPSLLQRPALIAIWNQYTISDQIVLLAIGVEQRLRDGWLDNF